MHELQRMAMCCDIDAFCKRFAPIDRRHLLPQGPGPRLRQPALALSEIMIILVSLH
jgi:hypothetical protein